MEQVILGGPEEVVSGVIKQRVDRDLGILEEEGETINLLTISGIEGDTPRCYLYLITNYDYSRDRIEDPGCDEVEDGEECDGVPENPELPIERHYELEVSHGFGSVTILRKTGDVPDNIQPFLGTFRFAPQ